jgi:transcriptional regulator with XRE-family HTH domain
MLGWSQQDLADRSGISARTVAAVELATNTPKRKTILQLAECLEAAGIRFGRTREYWPFVALKPSAEGETALPQMVDAES